MIYLTFNDNISGIFKSQVIDVLFTLNKINNDQIKLIAFFSIRNYFNQKKQLNKLYPNSISLPMFPKLKNWKCNVFLFKFFTNNDTIICRGVFATNIALKVANSRVVYDGRGAVKEEFKEYNVAGNFSYNLICELEKKAVVLSNFRIAVSEKLVEYWRNQFDYKIDEHIIIPCTVSKKKHKIMNL